MHILRFTIALLLASSAAHAQTEGQSLACIKAFHELETAAEFTSAEQLAAAIAQKFSKDYPLFYTFKFANVAIDQIEIEFRLGTSRRNEFPKSKEVRKKISDMQADRAYYAPNLARIGQRAWAQIVSDFTRNEQTETIKQYELRKKDFEETKQFIVLINNNAILRQATEKLIEDVIYNSLDLLTTTMRLRKLSRNIRFFGDSYDESMIIYPLLPLYPSAYKMVFYKLYYKTVDSFKTKAAIQKSVQAKPALYLPTSLNLNSVKRDPVNASFAELRERLSLVPESSLLATHAGVRGYDTAFNEAFFELTVKGLAKKEAFADPAVWEQATRFLQSQIEALEPANPVYSPIAITLNRLSRHIEAYHLSVQEEKWALAAAIDTFEKMKETVTQAQQSWKEPLTRSDELTRQAQEDILERLKDVERDAADVAVYLDEGERKTVQAAAIIRDLTRSFSAPGTAPDKKTLLARIQEITKLIQGSQK